MSNKSPSSKKLNSLDLLKLRKKFITESYDNVASQRDSWIGKNKYYYDYFKKILRFIVESQSSVLQIKCETGYYLDAVNPRYGLGLDYSINMVQVAKDRYKHLDFEVQDLENINIKQKFEYVLLVNALGDVVDVQKLLSGFKDAVDHKTRIIIINYNALWQPLINLANLLRLKIKQPTQNWLSACDMENLLYLTGYEIVKSFNIILCPIYIPVIANFLNNIVARLPLLQRLCLDHVFVVRKVVSRKNYRDYSVSVVIPCKDEKDNIENIVQRIPQIGKHTEMIFCDDKSQDGTVEEILRVKGKYSNKNIKLIYGPGICKSKNVWAGFEAAEGDILMILDADLTVIPEELTYFFEAIVEGKGEFINGSRLIYPMEEGAMNFSKILGNKFFSLLFSYILDQRIKDTLCGTKVFWRDDYFRMKKYIGHWGADDLWGDYDLLFSATKLNLKIIDLPVHYFDRTYGYTKMKNVLFNGTRMLRISLAALTKVKFLKGAKSLMGE